jgi:Tol biopolymer transport system component
MNGRNRKLILWAAAAAMLALLAIAAWRWSWWTGQHLPAQWTAIERIPRIRPDYRETVIPPNIAPLNFLVEEPGLEYRVRIHGHEGNDILVSSRSSSIVIPMRPWRELLRQTRGDRIYWEVYVKGENGRWSRFDPIEIGVAREEIDSHLVYRLLGPVCNSYNDLGIYQRNLENYDQSPILTNDTFVGCLNCHSFANNRPDLFSFHVRPGGGAKKNDPGMIVVRDGRAQRFKSDKKAIPNPPGYISWHPSGSLAAFTMGTTRQIFRGAGAEIRNVYDLQSSLVVANVRTGAVLTSPGIADPDRLETFPCWSADGKTLYFSSAKMFWGQDKPPPLADLAQTKYDLMCVRFDAEKNAFSPPETVLSAESAGLSITEPRTSPDGRYLLFCMSEYGGFPVHQSSCDLYLMDLATGKFRRLQCNSDQSDSWHCWSSNSRWIVFSSKRDNGLLARPYFSYIDPDGREHKPFVLPQKDPAFYDSWLKTYNVPELVTGPVVVSKKELLQAIGSGEDETGGPSKTEAPARAYGGMK